MKKILSVFRTFEGYDESFFYSYLNELSCKGNIEFVNFDDTTFIQFQISSMQSRLARKLIRKKQVILFNEVIREYITIYKPDLFIFFKANYLESSTLELAKLKKVKVIGIYPDLEPNIHGSDYIKVLNLADVLIHTKPNLANYFNTLNNNSICVNPFYSFRHLKKILPYNKAYGISFIGHHSVGKKDLIGEISLNLDENITIYGDRWKGKFDLDRNINVNNAAFGPPIYDIYRKSLFVLGLLTEKLDSFKDGDVLTARSVQIPALGGLILHPRNKYSENFFGDRHEMLFSNIDEISIIHENLLNDLNLRNELFESQKTTILEKGTQIEKLINLIINDYEKCNYNNFNIYK
tara:strand:+ start:6701 stop:7750 length:1050 start_codon:yes stop_codon:yes gene_type:complete